MEKRRRQSQKRIGWRISTLQYSKCWCLPPPQKAIKQANCVKSLSCSTTARPTEVYLRTMDTLKLFCPKGYQPTSGRGSFAENLRLPQKNSPSSRLARCNHYSQTKKRINPSWSKSLLDRKEVWCKTLTKLRLPPKWQPQFPTTTIPLSSHSKPTHWQASTSFNDAHKDTEGKESSEDATAGAKDFIKWLYTVHLGPIQETRLYVEADSNGLARHSEEHHRLCILPPSTQVTMLPRAMLRRPQTTTYSTS